MTPLRRRLRRLRRALWLSMAGVLILAAVAVGLVNLALPWLASDPARFAAWIEARLGQPVRVEAVGAQWLRSGPAFRLVALRLGGEDGIDVDAAELRVNIYAWLLPRRALLELRLNGLDMEVVREAGGSFELRGLILPERGVGSGHSLPGALSVRNSRLRVRDAESGLDLRLEGVNLSYSRQGNRAYWNGSGRPAAGSSALGFAIEHEQGDGRAYLVGGDLQLVEWMAGAAPAGVGVRSGGMDLEAWMEWRGGRLSEVRVETELADLGLYGVTPLQLGAVAVEPRTHFERLSLGARWSATGDDWRLDVEDLALVGPNGAELTPGLRLAASPGGRLRLEAERMALTPLTVLVALADVAPAELRGWLFASAARGNLEDLLIDIEGGRLAWIEGHVEALALRPHGRVPGIGPLSLRISGDHEGLVATVSDQHSLVDAPRLFDTPLFLQRLDGRIGLARRADGWQLELAGATLDLGGFPLAVDARVELGGDEGPRLSASARVGEGRIEHVHPFWPVGIMPPRTLRWLQSALISGTLEGASLVFQGPFSAWPFKGAEGRFEAVAQVDDSLLEFNREWPPVEALDARARFVNDSLQVDASGAAIAGNRIQLGEASIADFAAPLLDVRLVGEGAGPQLLGLLRRSPINHRFGSYLVGVEVGGRARVDLDLQFALKRALGSDRVNGEVWLERADLRDAKWGLAFDRATGRVRFDQDGFAADELNVWLDEDPAHLSIAVGSGTGHRDNLAEASLRGMLPLAAVTSGFADIEPLWPRVRGRSQWTLDLTVARGEQDLDGAKRLRMHSDLVGAEVRLPAPLGKPAEAALPLSMDISLPAHDGELLLDIEGLARLRARLPGLQQSFAAALMLGGEAAQELPAEGLSVRGRLPELDLSGWMALGGGVGPGGPVDVAVDVDRLRVLGSDLGEVELALRSDPAATQIAFRGHAVEGLVDLPAGGARAVTANFERLHWPGGGGSEVGAIEVDPAALPAMYLWIGDLRLGDARLGETRLETYPTARGLHVELLESQAEHVDVRARGDWLHSAMGDRSSFELSFSAENLGRMLDAFGYSGFVEGGQTLAQFNVTWPGTPAAFALDRLSGSLDISIGSGRILEVEPGAGRILGLASLQAIPRRLALDFSDLFAPGMSFNAINGSFRFADGSAWTENLRLDGPAAAVGIRGRTGLADRSYDQELDVYPRVGGALPVFGAIAGGPAGAAAGLVVQNVLARPLDQVARARYRVTGSWDEPQIEQVPVPRPRPRESGPG